MTLEEIRNQILPEVFKYLGYHSDYYWLSIDNIDETIDLRGVKLSDAEGEKYLIYNKKIELDLDDRLTKIRAFLDKKHPAHATYTI